MNIALILEGPLAFDGTNYLIGEGEGIYIDGISGFFEEVILCAYVLYDSDEDYETVCNYQFSSSNITIVELPRRKTDSKGFFPRVARFINVFRTILKFIKQWDLLYIFLPGFPGAFTYIINIFFRKKYFLYLASDWSEEAELLFPWQGIKKYLLLPVFKKFTELTERKAVEGAFLVLTAGKATYDKYYKTGVPIYETIPRLNWKDLEIYNRKDTCQSNHIKLLYIGYLLPRKGILYLLEALTMLQELKDYTIDLTIVGSGIHEGELKEYTQIQNLSRKVQFTGHIPNKDIFKYYRECDIFIAPSYSGEGFPRVLYEAMSQSIPIITTDVCGIPYKMKHEDNALIVKSKSSEEIAYAVERLISNEMLRKKIIHNGREFMNELIPGNSVSQVYELIKKYYPLAIEK